MENNLQLLSGNEALALGAYHAGVQLAAAYPGTPSTEILENLSRFKDIYAEWSTNEKVAMEVAMGAAYTGARAMVSMKHVGLNVASDPFMAASITGIVGGLVVVCADDPQIHSSQNEQDNRHYARLAKVPMLEPGDSQDAYDLMGYAFDISENFDTPVLLRTTTRISHSKSVVDVNRTRAVKNQQPTFHYNVQKYVMLPVNALPRHALVEERMVKLADYVETFPMNQITRGSHDLGIVTSGVAYNYAREVFPDASFLRLAMTWPLPEKMIKEFADGVKRLIVIEELDPFLQDNIKAMGIKVSGKEFIPLVGELNTRIVGERSAGAGLLPESEKVEAMSPAPGLPRRPPLLCPGCPHTGIYFVLNSIGQRSRLLEKKDDGPQEPKLIITGDIGCYTLGALPPLNVLDTTACMGAGIGQALGMEKAGVKNRVVAVIGDSTFMHSGITGLVDAVYNDGHITILILDNRTTAMTGHQDHPGTGVSAQGQDTYAVDIEALVRGIGVRDVKVVNAFNLKEVRAGVRDSLDRPEVSVVIVRGNCAMLVRKRAHPRVIDAGKCDQCGICLRLGCPAIQSEDGQPFIEATLCAGDICTICEQLCPQKAISKSEDVA
ncbi:MAG: indolepyruvate ferredoxin oxidoreductase subunit alpha [Chloroflexi bacterium RBG_16_60_22]|nr:MAG: indolepyruvate ferredoxin oxidoreductase subunit alpha [Chloroflexi bacterium RBG_16_60_22]